MGTQSSHLMRPKKVENLFAKACQAFLTFIIESQHKITGFWDYDQVWYKLAMKPKQRRSWLHLCFPIIFMQRSDFLMTWLNFKQVIVNTLLDSFFSSLFKPYTIFHSFWTFRQCFHSFIYKTFPSTFRKHYVLKTEPYKVRKDGPGIDAITFKVPT